MTYPLREILVGYRQTVEKAWTADTAHEGYAGAAGSPVGQCGVTSAWLQRRLLDDHDRVTLFMEGLVHYGPDWTEARHCWLSDVSGRLIDLTADQFPAPVMAYERTSALLAEQITDESLLARVALLTKAVRS